MALESATYITDLVDTNPAAGDNVSQGDDHLRLIKSTLQATFSGFTGAAVTATEAELNDVGDIRTDLTTAETAISTAETNITALQQRVVAGIVDDAGDFVGGTAAWTALGTPSVRNAAGNYTVNLPYTGSWVVTLTKDTVNDSSPLLATGRISGLTATSFTCQWEAQTDGSDRNAAFHFVAVDVS